MPFLDDPTVYMSTALMVFLVLRKPSCLLRASTVQNRQCGLLGTRC